MVSLGYFVDVALVYKFFKIIYLNMIRLLFLKFNPSPGKIIVRKNIVFIVHFTRENIENKGYNTLFKLKFIEIRKQKCCTWI